MTLTRVYPTAGRLVRDPITRARLPATGADVDLRDSYWSRRQRDGDITDQAPAAVPAVEAAAAPAVESAAQPVAPAAAAPKSAGKKK